MQEASIVLYVMETVGSAVFLTDSINANWGKRILRVKKEHHLQIKQRQAPSHQSYSTEGKLKPEHSK